MPRYIGLDVHRRYVHACEFRPELPEGQQERHFRFPNTPEAWTAFAAHLDREAVVTLGGNRKCLRDPRYPFAPRR